MPLPLPPLMTMMILVCGVPCGTGMAAFCFFSWRANTPSADPESAAAAAAAHPKPTLLLGSLPPSITRTAITDLLCTATASTTAAIAATNTTTSAPAPLKIDAVRIIPAPPPSGPAMPSSAIRKAASALVTLTADTPASDIDAAVSALNGRYMGYGFWLSIVRHLSSAVAGSAAAAIPSIGTPSHPFGARAPRPSHGRGGQQHHNSHHSHHHHRGGVAPPSSFGQGGGGGRRERQQPPTPPSNALQIHVQAPGDLKTLKLIHRTIETLLTHGPEFEALLMSQDSVRHDPKFAWLWDARSEAGVYYRWKLWEILTGFSVDKPFTPTVELFDTANSVWIPPRRPLKYEFASSLEDVVDDYAFQSDEDDDGSDLEHHHHHSHSHNRHQHQQQQSQQQSQSQHPHQQAGPLSYLGVLERAKLLHLVARVPTTTSKVRRGDVGRVMAFAMEHAEGGRGEEVVAVLVANVLRPLAFTRAAPAASLEADASSAKIVALWLISDVLSNSSLGVRAAWRYRQLFENALRERRVFAHLGDIYRESGWGRMKAEKFRRMVVEGVLEGWEVRLSGPVPSVWLG